MKKEELIGVVMQAFYGNRTFTKLSEDKIDSMLEGWTGDEWKVCGLKYADGRVVVKLPGTDCVLVYNRHQEANQLKTIERWYREDGYRAKPLAAVPELGIIVYSRCFLCRMSSSGKLESIRNDDREIVARYLAP